VADGVRLAASTLIERFGVPDKVARAVERLNAAKIDTTADVLRAAANDPGVAAVLTSSRLRSAPKRLTTEKVRALAESVGATNGAAAELVVVPKRIWKTLAFAREEGRLPALAPVTAPAPMKASELASLFSPDEVKRLKLSVLTSADSEERITAIRQLTVAPGTAREKGAALLVALSDDAPRVRLEAIEALVPLGLNPDIAREARALVSGTDKQRLAAAGRIGELAGQAGSGEVSVLLTLIAGSLRAELPDDARRALVLALAPAAPAIAGDPAQLAGAVALVAEQLTERPVDLSRTGRQVLAALGREDPARTVAALEAETDRAPDPAARRVLLNALSALDVPGDRRRPLVEKMIDEIIAAPEPETDCLGIANALCRWGAAAAEVVLERLADALRQQKTFLLRILDDIASRPDAPLRTKTGVAETFLRLLKTDTSTVRAVLLESSLFADAALPDRLRAKLAEELIQHVHEFGGPRMIGTIEETIARLGPPAIEPLVRLLTEGVRERERVSAARVLGELIARLPARGAAQTERIEGVLMTCVRQLDGGFPDRDVLAAAVGRMCTSPAMPTETVQRVARGLRVRVGREAYSFGLLEGLGNLASSPNVELETRVVVAQSLLRLLEHDLPEMQSKRFTGGEKTIFIAGNEAAAYTDMIPILLDGLRNVAIHAGADTLRDRVVRALIAKWHEASSWRLVWGPANTLKLAEVLGEVALAAGATPRVRLDVARALTKGPDVLPVLRVLGRLLATDGAAPEMGEVAASVAQRLLRRMGPGSGDRIETDETVTTALGAIGARQALGPDTDAARLRRAIAEVLYKAFRNGAPGARAALDAMARSRAVDAELREEIEGRIGGQR
jgi:hypothetical protein